MKHILVLISLFGFMFYTNASWSDDFSFDDFAIVEDVDDDINMESVSLNSGADVINVNQFDIAGIMLGMNYDEVNNLFDYECRQNNIFVPEQLEKCIYSLARNRGLMYVSEIHLERAFTGETIDVYFTSNATDNIVWKVVYKNDVNTMDGDSEKFANIREKKILAFWQGIIDKYGEPNSGEDKWISSENAYDPMMQAFYGQLTLINQGINATDSSENIQKARENFQAKPYAF